VPIYYAVVLYSTTVLYYSTGRLRAPVQLGCYPIYHEDRGPAIIIIVRVIIIIKTVTSGIGTEADEASTFPWMAFFLVAGAGVGAVLGCARQAANEKKNGEGEKTKGFTGRPVRCTPAG
jgi:hypothetical protein